MQTQEHKFLVAAMLNQPDNLPSRSLGSFDFPHSANVVQPSPFTDIPPSGDLILPSIGANKPTPGGKSREGTRKGGGFRVGPAPSKAKLQQAMSAPNVLVERLTAEDRRGLAEKVLCSCVTV